MTVNDNIKCRFANSGVTDQVGGFQNPGVCLQAFPSLLPHPLPALLLAPLSSRSLTLVPRSFLLNRTETLATQASCGLLPRLSLLVSSFSFASTDKDELLSNYQLNYSGQRAEILTQRSNANLMPQRAKNTLINVVTYPLFSPDTRIFPWHITSAECTEKDGRISSHLPQGKVK